MTALSDFFQALGKYDFLQSALITAIMVGIMSGIIGSFIILRGMSLMGDAISHSVLPGVAVAYMLGINILIGASIFGVLAAMLIGYVASHSKIKVDTAIGVVFSFFYALGFILISMAESSTNLHHILFGNILAVSNSDMITTAIVLGIVIIFVQVFYKELLITSFDQTFAKTYGLNTQLIHYSLMLVLTLVTVSALQTVGIILVVAMLITPAATAYFWTDRLSVMLVFSAIFGVVASIRGLYFSYTFNWASGPAIVIVAAGLFLISFIFSPKQNLLHIHKNRKEA
ncbi:ABC transporter permease [Enterococcus durans]|uniref:Manganese import system permease protein ScaB n=1 Tax=Enterococcus durans TaxID=53345 RepID=A0A377KIY0_9ENTE|nr:metal ABC transporter permease [Enterococcus durans]STP29150.1 ABC transporter permease [Enterococcus durans]